MIGMSVDGLAEVDKNLAALGSKDGTRILRKSMLLGATPILNQAKANLASMQRGSGALYQAMGMRFVVGNAKRSTFAVPPMGGKFFVQVYPASKNRIARTLHNQFYKRQTGGIFHGHLVERGFRHRSGKQVRAQPFLVPALESKGSTAIAIFATEMKTGIEAMTARNARRQKKRAKHFARATGGYYIK